MVIIRNLKEGYLDSNLKNYFIYRIIYKVNRFSSHNAFLKQATLSFETQGNLARKRNGSRPDGEGEPFRLLVGAVANR